MLFYKLYKIRIKNHIYRADAKDLRLTITILSHGVLAISVNKHKKTALKGRLNEKSTLKCAKRSSLSIRAAIAFPKKGTLGHN